MTTSELAAHALTPDTGINMTISVAAAAVFATCVFVMKVTWRVAYMVRNIHDLAEKLRETWSYECMNDWAHELERKNRSLQLHVPDPSVTRAKLNRASASGDESAQAL